MLNGIFITIVLLSILMAAFSGQMEMLSQSMLDSAKSAVSLALGLIGVMAFFLGIMRVASEGGILEIITRALHPILRFLFPNIPNNHPAMGAMILNISSNLLGLGNAATPFGLKAMMELDRLNTNKGTATNAMILFLAINTSGLALLPTGVIGLRAAAGSQDAAGILATTWFASGCATLAGIIVAILLSKSPWYRLEEASNAHKSIHKKNNDSLESIEKAPSIPTATSNTLLSPPRWGKIGVSLFYLALLLALGQQIYHEATGTNIGNIVRNIMSFWLLPILVSGLILFGWMRGVKVYDALVEGAKERFQVAIKIIPFLVAILVAMGMLRASGSLDLLAYILSPITTFLGMPPEVLPVALVRPLSGTGAMGVMTEIMNTYGPDSLIGYMASTFYGSTETTFYVLAVYFGSINITKTRHALPACLSADIIGILAATLIVTYFYS